MKHLIINEITQAHIEQLESAAEALAAVVLQFGAPITFRDRPARSPCGSCALEAAFQALCNCGCKTNSNGTIDVDSLLNFIKITK